MKRTILSAVLGIVAFGGLCFTGIYLATRDPGAGPVKEPPAPVAANETPQPAENAPVPGEKALDAAPKPLTKRRVLIPKRTDGGTARGPWRAPRVDEADPVTRKAVRKALLNASIQTRLARCVDRDIGFGSAPGKVPRGRPASLLLDLEARDHDLLVVGVDVERWGAASEETVSCARKVLRGVVFAVAPREPGTNLKIPFKLDPRKETLAVRR